MLYSFSRKDAPNRRNAEEGGTPAEEVGDAMALEMSLKEGVRNDIKAQNEWDWCCRNGNPEGAKRIPQARMGYSGAILSSSEYVGAAFPTLV